MNSAKPSDLKLDWCSREAAQYALKKWYYRDTMPNGKNARIGIWEHDKFIGVLIFGVGTNKNLASSIGFQPIEVCELMRVAMGKHTVPVSRIMGIALRILAKAYPGLKAVISYCDPEVGHYGGIYQATNWIYVGRTAPIDHYEDAKGNLHHWRAARHLQKKGAVLKKIMLPGKHKYVYPLSQTVRDTLASMAKPFPKPAAATGDHPDQGQSDGALPIQPLLEQT